jgi:hypothetical protein
MAFSNPTQSSGLSDNRANYQAAFLHRVHRLLQLAYESLDSSQYEKAEEDDITGDLCKHMKVLTEEAPSERWMARFSIHDQAPSDDVVSEKTGLPRKGKRRPKIDVRIVCKHQIPNRGYCIEAKRFYRGDSVSKYVNDEGVGAFICEEYAKDDDFGGMVGYIQKGAITDWVPKIDAKLAAETSTISKRLKSAQFKEGPKNCYTSTHLRESGREIELVHVMLYFGPN